MTINEKFLPTEQKPKFDIVTALLVLLFVVVFIGCYWYTTRLQDEFIQKQKSAYSRRDERFFSNGNDI